MNAAADLERYQRNLRGEVESAALYRLLAQAEQTPELGEVYRRLAAVEERHASTWQDKLREAGGTYTLPRIGLRVRLLGWLARRFGPDTVLPFVMAAEGRDSHAYDNQPEAAGMAVDERSHGRVFRTIVSSGRAMSGQTVARLEGRHRATGGNALRAAVLGVNDGLVSNLSLIMGVAGAAMAQSAILLTGLAGLLAGAISMGLGEWLSVQSSRELYARQLAIEKDELETAPAEELEELALIYQAKGIPAARAHELASSIMADPTTALDTLAREELGIDPQGLGGSAWVAASTSFALFALGALIPLLPFVVMSGLQAVIASGALAALALFTSGVIGSFFTGQPMLRTGLRHVTFGMAAAAVTYGLGRLVGGGLAA